MSVTNRNLQPSPPNEARGPRGEMNDDRAKAEKAKQRPKPWIKLVVSLILMGLVVVFLSVDCPWHLLGLHHAHDNHPAGADHHHHGHGHDHEQAHQGLPTNNLVRAYQNKFSPLDADFAVIPAAHQMRVLHLRSQKTSVSPSIPYFDNWSEKYGHKNSFVEVTPAVEGYEAVSFEGFDAVVFTVVDGDREKNGELIESALERGMTVAVVGSPYRSENMPTGRFQSAVMPGVMKHEFPPVEILVEDHPILAHVKSLKSKYKIRIDCQKNSDLSSVVVARWADNNNPAIAVSSRHKGLLAEFLFYIGDSLSEDGTQAVFNSLRLKRVS